RSIRRSEAAVISAPAAPAAIAAGPAVADEAARAAVVRIPVASPAAPAAPVVAEAAAAVAAEAATVATGAAAVAVAAVAAAADVAVASTAAPAGVAATVVPAAATMETPVGRLPAGRQGCHQNQAVHAPSPPRKTCVRNESTPPADPQDKGINMCHSGELGLNGKFMQTESQFSSGERERKRSGSAGITGSAFWRARAAPARREILAGGQILVFTAS